MNINIKNNIFIDKLKKISIFQHAYSKFLKKEKIFSRRDLYNYSKNKNNKSYKKIFFNTKDFKINGDFVKEKKCLIDPKLPSVLGWVPYIKNNTSIVLYNYFSTNYSLRKQALARISIIDHLQVVSQKCFWMPVFQIYEFELNKHFNNIIGDSVFIELFHPRISKNHGGHSGHLRTWGKYYNNNGLYVSTVHSMPHSNEQIYAKELNNCRTYFYNHNGVAKQIHSSTSKTKIIKKDFDKKNYLIPKSIYGFNIIKDLNNNPCAIWHQAQPAPSKLLKPKWTSHSFWFPKMNDLDPTLVIEDSETEVFNNQELSITIMKDSKIILKKDIKIEGFFSSSLSKIFKQVIEGPYIVICDFYSKRSGSIQFHCDTKKFPGDQVHAHENYFKLKGDNKIYSHFSGKQAYTSEQSKEVNPIMNSHNLNNKKNNIQLSVFKNKDFDPIFMMHNGSTRKFLHYHKGNYRFKHFLVIYTCCIYGIDYPTIKVRVFTDKKDEFIKSIKVNYNSPIMSLDIDEIFPNLNSNIEKIGIVQLESLDFNFRGYLMHCNLDKNLIAVDHLTGG